MLRILREVHVGHVLRWGRASQSDKLLVSAEGLISGEIEKERPSRGIGRVEDHEHWHLLAGSTACDTFHVGCNIYVSGGHDVLYLV